MAYGFLALALVGVLGSAFVVGSLMLGSNADDAAEDLSDHLIQQDWPHLPIQFGSRDRAA